MNTQELSAKITASGLSPERKEKALALLEGNVTADIVEKIKDLIQEDIDQDTTGVLTAEDMGEASVEDAKLEEGLSKVEQTLGEDMSFVETEMNDIDGMVQQMSKAVDEAEINKIKAELPTT